MLIHKYVHTIGSVNRCGSGDLKFEEEEEEEAKREEEEEKTVAKALGGQRFPLPCIV